MDGARYRTIPVSFAPLPAPAFTIEARWDLPAFLAYPDTWSAAQRYLKQLGKDPFEAVRPALEQAWENPAEVRTVSWPLILVAGRVKP